MKTYSAYFFITIIVCIHCTHSMEENREKNQVIIEVEEEKKIEEVSIIIGADEPARTISLISDEEAKVLSVSVDEPLSSALSVIQANDSKIIIRWHNLIANKLVTEYALDDAYKIVDNGTITLNGVFFILAKKENLKQGAKPLFLLDLYNRGKIDEIDCTLSKDDQLCFGDHNSSINSQNGLWKAIALPNTKGTSRIMLYNPSNEIVYTFYPDPASSVKTYLSYNAESLIYSAIKNQSSNLIHIYDIFDKKNPQHIKSIMPKTTELYFMQKNNFFSDYKNIYDGLTGEEIREENQAMGDNDLLIGCNNVYAVTSYKNTQAVACYNKIDKKTTFFQPPNHNVSSKKAFFMNKNKECAVSYHNDKNNTIDQKIYIYTLTGPQEEKRETTSYFICNIL